MAGSKKSCKTTPASAPDALVIGLRELQQFLREYGVDVRRVEIRREIGRVRLLCGETNPDKYPHALRLRANFLTGVEGTFVTFDTADIAYVLGRGAFRRVPQVIRMESGVKYETEIVLVPIVTVNQDGEGRLDQSIARGDKKAVGTVDYQMED